MTYQLEAVQAALLSRIVDYVLNEKGQAHPSLSRWLEEEIENTAATLASPLPTTNSAALR
ncbi:MAG: hypothetical protein NTNFB02_02920 [Nitrospira sp.]